MLIRDDWLSINARQEISFSFQLQTENKVHKGQIKLEVPVFRMSDITHTKLLNE
jgi:hypothetical protein